MYLDPKQKMKFYVQGKIPNSNKLLVRGYVFQQVTLINNYILPEIIIYLCIMYFNSNIDDWRRDRVHQSIEILESTIKRNSHWGRKSAILSNVVAVGLHIWKFEIMNCYDVIEIGIIPVPINIQKCKCYGLSNGEQALWKNFVTGIHYRCISVKSRDIIVLRLHFGERQVTFWRNNNLVGSFEILETSYSAGVTLTDDIAEVKLLSYQETVCLK